MFYSSLDEQIKIIENKKKKINRIKELYTYFFNKKMSCPFCNFDSNVELINRHIKSQKCREVQNSLKLIKGNEKIQKALEVIKYNRIVIKNNYKRRNEEDYNENELIIFDLS
jgi:hypothetical protein